MKKDYINIYRENSINGINDHINKVSSKSDFFSGRIKYTLKEEYIHFELADIDSVNYINPHLRKNGYYVFSLYGLNLPKGKFYFDEDSNEDEVFIFFED